MDYDLPTLDTPAMRELAEHSNWVAWREVIRGGKATKVPIDPKTGKFASVTNPRTWGTFDEAYALCQQSVEYAGIGFVFTDRLPYTGVDLDKCREPETEALEDWATGYVEKLSSYTEVSPSATGVHIIVRGKPTLDRKRIGKLEVYPSLRYFTVTGVHVEGAPDVINERSAELDEILSTAYNQGPAAERPTGDVDLDALILEIKEDIHPDATAPQIKLDVLSANATIVKQTWDHERKDGKDWSLSQWDMSLANFFIAAGWSHREIGAALVAHRRRWGGDKLDRVDYYARTILAAHDGRGRDEAQERMAGDNFKHLSPEDQERVGLDSLSQVYGVGFSRVTKYVGEPTTWVITTELGQITGGIDMLMKQDSFRRAMAEATDVLLPKCGPTIWEARAQMLLTAARHDTLGDDATVRGQIESWLIEYIAFAPTAPADFEDATVLAGDPFYRNGRLHIVGEGFRLWLLRVRMERPTAAKRGLMLRLIEAEPAKVTAVRPDGRPTSRSVWMLPMGFEKRFEEV
jgi:hypothetical protein|tara:strand:- start:4006 stop:5559 length:1554 start_codon:yes stop_codon:yes gene_type:complete